jgi:hypothetical protein
MTLRVVTINQGHNKLFFHNEYAVVISVVDFFLLIKFVSLVQISLSSAF